MMKYINEGMIQKITLATMPDFFTLNEIEAMTVFNTSQTGQAILRKMGAYSQASSVKIMEEIMPFIMQIQQELASK